ncbi:MAG: hypothetical protein FIA95_10880 [Gemmatimonadetes bacterium]|nr:hypothetical protein [Gemmatimonadota bacterium]
MAPAGASSAEDVFQSYNREGVTPVLVDVLPGLYEVGFVLPKGSGEPAAEYAPRFEAGLGHAIITSGSGYRVVFSGVAKGDSAGSFIGLAFDAGLDDAQVSQLYPAGQNFKGYETGLREVFAARSFDPQGLPLALELLGRGGKVLLRAKPPFTTVELKIDGTLEVTPPLGG